MTLSDGAERTPRRREARRWPSGCWHLGRGGVPTKTECDFRRTSRAAAERPYVRGGDPKSPTGARNERGPCSASVLPADERDGQAASVPLPSALLPASVPTHGGAQSEQVAADHVVTGKGDKASCTPAGTHVSCLFTGPATRVRTRSTLVGKHSKCPPCPGPKGL